MKDDKDFLNIELDKNHHEENIEDNAVNNGLKIGFDSEGKNDEAKLSDKTVKPETVNEDKMAKQYKKYAEKGRMKKPIFMALRVLMICAAGLAFSYAAYDLTDSYLDYVSAQEKYSEIDDMFLQVKEEENQSDAANATGDDALQVGETSPEYHGALTKWVWDYDAMLEYNNESKGYIKLDGTRIQYPIVQHTDNKYYLVRGSDKISNGNGAIFLDARCAGGLDANMSVLYGHNMMDGSMFAELMNFSKDEFSKTHQTFDVYVGNRHYIYYVFSSFRANAKNDDIYKFGMKDDSELSAWINRVYSKRSFDYDYGKPDTSDKIIMCSTCVDNNDNRQIVCLVRGEEVVD